MGSNFSNKLKTKLFPKLYSEEILASGDFSFLLMKKGALTTSRYAVGFMCLSKEMTLEDFWAVRSNACKLTKSMWLFREVGIYLIFCGPEKYWESHTKEITADKSGLHSIIVNAVHFVDPESKATHLSTSSWGSVEFGNTGFISGIVDELLMNSDVFDVDVVAKAINPSKSSLGR
jgi:hypothetical protein